MSSHISDTKLALHTAFSIGRVTAYLLIPAVLASISMQYLGESTSMGLIKVGIFLAVFLFSWLLIGLDYWFIMRKIPFTQKQPADDTK